MTPREKLGKMAADPRFLALAAALLPFLWFADRTLAVKLEDLELAAGRREAELEASGAALEELRTLRDLKLQDVEDYKKALRKQARSKKNVYEAGAALQEEKRLLEKQLEILTTYLKIDEETGKIALMRGDRALKDYPFSYPQLRTFGAGAGNSPSSARIISKERFANPERGKVQETDGKLSWEPPQVGNDPRSGGLGEYVLFTDGPLILHGPPPKTQLHDAYPHVCAGVTAYTARQLFENTFVGTKVLYEKKKKVPAAGPPAAAKKAKAKR